MTPDGVHGDERRTVLDELTDVDGMKPVDVFVGSHHIEDASFRIRAHGLGKRRLDENPVVHFALIEALDHRKQFRQ